MDHAGNQSGVVVARGQRNVFNAGTKLLLIVTAGSMAAFVFFLITNQSIGLLSALLLVVPLAEFTHRNIAERKRLAKCSITIDSNQGTVRFANCLFSSFWLKGGLRKLEVVPFAEVLGVKWDHPNWYEIRTKKGNVGVGMGMEGREEVLKIVEAIVAENSANGMDKVEDLDWRTRFKRAMGGLRTRG